MFVRTDEHPHTRFCLPCFADKHPRIGWKETPFEDLWNNEVRKKRIFIETGGRECQSCHLVEWMGKPISLELEHINGDPKDGRRENCKVLCPNCHSQTPTWKWRNRKDRKITPV
jgi:5-methylcytosine-specific restriction endonuclease McrA